MQSFGLVGILIAVMLGIWWMTASLQTETYDEGGAPVDTAYKDAISSAKDVVNDISTNKPAFGQVIVYEGIGVSKGEQKLDLSGRGLDGSLKAEIRQLTELRELDLSNNNFTGLPAEVGQLSKLEVLNLSNNPLTGLPHEIGNLQNLKTLNIRDIDYSTSDLKIIRKNLPETTRIMVN